MGRIEASLVDAANPCVFVAAETVGQRGTEMPDVLEARADTLQKLESIRCAASVAMGLAKDLEQAASMASVPKVAMVSAPHAARTLSGRELGAGDMDIAVRMISIGQPHRAAPLTGALCLAVATRIAGSIPNAMAGSLGHDAQEIRIAQPSGLTVVDARLMPGDRTNELVAEYAAVYRTARRLFEGRVLCRVPGRRAA
jgi:hypothetical protein